MTGRFLVMQGNCETVLHTKDRAENPISKENLPTVENNKGLGKAQSNADSLLKINKEPGLVKEVMTNE
jgi:hypothetical protein